MIQNKKQLKNDKEGFPYEVASEYEMQKSQCVLTDTNAKKIRTEAFHKKMK